MSRRIVIDTSTLVGAALRSDSTPRKALLEALATSDLCASTETLAELERVLDNKKFDRYLDQTLRREFVALIRRQSHIFAVETTDLEAVEPPCRDPEDNKFLALALAAEANVLISSDDDLLVLQPWRGIPIVTPADFLSRGKSDDLEGT